MKKQVLIVGVTGGIGSACYDFMRFNSEFEVHGWSSKDVNFDRPETIFDTDVSAYDIIINCAGHNQGTYLGFLRNTWQNQISQVMVNYVANLFLLKHFANSRTYGQYVWCSTDLAVGVTPYKSVYLSTKIASQFAIDLVRQEAQHINILEVQFQSVKSNLRFRNFEGTLSAEQIAQTYGDQIPLSAQYVAEKIVDSLNNNLEKVLIE